MQGGQRLEGDTRTERTDDRGRRNEQRPRCDTATEIGLSEDEVFDVLRNSRRRSVIAYLQESGEQASLKELTEHVASEEYEVSTDQLSPDHRKRVYTGLYQCHLPRLEKFGVIEFDTGDKTVTLSDAASEVDAYLHRDTGFAVVHVEFATAAAVATVATLGLLGVGPFGYVSVVAWALLTVLALVGIVLIRQYNADM